ncbi:MAG: hypothetical protein MUP58_00530 [Candidatus Nanohaloarchaeota archaeon QJJ-9]|nr:hypothetical protein [Candidatus Nanohaloarchaeota archaeon QJJ-9]
MDANQEAVSLFRKVATLAASAIAALMLLGGIYYTLKVAGSFFYTTAGLIVSFVGGWILKGALKPAIGAALQLGQRTRVFLAEHL